MSWDKFETVLVKVLQRYGYKYQTNERIRAKMDEVTRDDHEGHLQSARRMFQAENAGSSPGLGGHHVVQIQDWGRLLHYYGPIHKRGAPAKEFLLRVRAEGGVWSLSDSGTRARDWVENSQAVA